MRRFQILKITFGVLLLLWITGCATENALVQTPKPDTPAPLAKVSTIQKISFTEEENYTRIQVEGSETIAPPFYKLLSDPLRIAIDVPKIKKVVEEKEAKKEEAPIKETKAEAPAQNKPEAPASELKKEEPLPA